MSLDGLAGKLMKDAMKKVKGGDFHGGIQTFIRLTNEYPGSDLADNAYYNLGICHKQLRDTTKAVLAFRTVVERYPDSDAAPMAQDQLEDLENLSDAASDHYLKAENFLHQGDLDQAARGFKELLQNFPDSNLADNAMFAMGMIAKKMDRLEDAHKIAKRVIQDYPGSDAAHEAQLMLDS